MISKEKLVFDPANPDDTDNSGAFVRSADGTLITSVTDGGSERLEVSTGAEHYEGTSFAGGEKGSLSLAVDSTGTLRPLKVNADGELLVDVQVETGADKAEGMMYAPGDIGSFSLSVRNDTLVQSTPSNGMYQAFKTDSLGALWTNVAKQAPATHSGWEVSSLSVQATAVAVTASSNRKTVLIQNVGLKPVYLGSSNSVTVSNGMRLSAGAAIELELATGAAIHLISDATGTDVRIAQFNYVA